MTSLLPFALSNGNKYIYVKPMLKHIQHEDKFSFSGMQYQYICHDDHAKSTVLQHF